MSDPMAALAGLSPREQRVLLERLLRERAAQPRRSPLSASQQRLWFLDQLDPGSTAYNIPAAVRMDGTLDFPALRASLDEVVRRHETLRTAFGLDGDEPVQIVSPLLRLALPVVDLRLLPPASRLREMRRLAREEALAPFDLARGPLLRATLVRVGNREHVALLTMHHIICDGWSMGVLVREIATLYDVFVRGLPSPLPALPIQYSDYARWQRSWLLGEEVEAQLAYWKKRLAGNLPVLDLPTDRPRPPVPSGRGAVRSLSLPAELVLALQRVGERCRVTLFMVLLAVFKTLLHRYSRQDDILVGSAIANRRQSEVEGLIGMFVNTLALRTDMSGDPTFPVLLDRVHEMAVGAYTHQDLPFERLVNALRPERQGSHQPIFQVLFVLQNVPMDHIGLPGLTFSPFELDVRAEVFDLTLALAERGAALAGYLTFNTDLFEAATAARLLGHFETLLRAVATEPDRPISVLPLLTEAESRELRAATEGGAAAGWPEVFAHELFERQAERTPEEVAVLFEDEGLTYRELDERSNRLARHLQSLGVGCDARVGLCLERSLGLLVGVLAVLKAGAAYVPLDPTYPRERLSYMLETAAVTVLVTQEDLLPVLPAGAVPVVAVDRDRERISGLDAGRLERLAAPESLAYVIFTSGSTGRSKGVAMVHRALTNLILWQLGCPGFESPATTLQFASLSFDVSFQEIFTTLGGGGTLVLVSEGVRRDAHALVAVLAEQRVERLFVPFVMLQQIAEAAVSTGPLPVGLRQLISAGEQLRVTPALIAMAEALPGLELYNQYGPSESHVVTAFRASSAPTSWPDLPPIGRPIPGTRAVSLGPHFELAPVGLPAEILIGGVALARGYLSRPDLTAERFVPDPYAGEPGGRLYRTGDLAKRLPDGDLEFLRRIDDQVKVRGFRIELGEVEAVLARHPGVRQTVAAVSERGGARQLVAYVVVDLERPPQATELRAHLQRELPEYMIPAAFVRLQELPLTPSGKVDRRALPAPEPERQEISSTFAAPHSPLEERLAAIWAEVLAVGRVGITDNFFELGGDSILSIQLVVSARRHGLRFTPDQLFHNPTVSELARVTEILSARRGGEPQLRRTADIGSRLAGLGPDLAGWLLKIHPGAVDAYSLSPMQQGILVHALMTPSPGDYAEQFSTVIRGRFDAEAFAGAWKIAVARHPVLRTCFIWEDLDEPLQVVLGEVELPIEPYDLRGFDAAEQRRRMTAYVRSEQEERGFDPARAPLLRIALFACADDLQEFVWSCHALVLDGWSGPLLLKEVHDLYEALAHGEHPQPSPAPAYRSYIEWLGRQDLAPAESFWRRELAGFDTPTRLGEAQAAGAAVGREYELEVVALGDGVSTGLRALAREAQVTLNTVAQGAWALVLERHGGGSDVVLGGVVSGRPADLPEVESMLGLLLNTLPVRVEIPSDAPVGEWLRGIQSRQLAARRFEFSPLTRIQRWSEVPQGQRLFQSILAFANYPQDSGGSWAIHDWSVQKTGYPVFLLVRPGERLVLDLTYDRRHLSRTAALRLLGHLRTGLEALAERPRQLSAVEVLTAAERAQLLTEWNDTATPLPESCFLELFAARAAANPGAVAAVCGDERLTYGELDRRTERLARALLEAGVKSESIVALLDERDLDFLTAVLAVFKAGGAYLPLDPRHPVPRVLRVLESSRAAILLAGRGAPAPLLDAVAGLASDRGPRCLRLAAALDGREERRGGMALPPAPTPEQLAYVIYTSGSTGVPKGAMVTHAGMLNHVLAKVAELELTAADAVAQNASQCFDISVWQLLAVLAVGGCVYMVPDELAHDPGRLLPALRASEITILEIVPSLLRLLLEEAERDEARRGIGAVRTVIPTGEALPPELCRRWFAMFPSTPLLNAYGPTECSDDVTHHRLDNPPPPDTLHVPIGRPLSNTRLHVLDRHLHTMPAEVPGELCVGGVGVGRGYMNDPSRTAAVFLPDPFGGTGARLYRTGDRARFFRDGNLEFLGRVDYQVKIRGYRIELGEVEVVLLRHPAVREAVVIVREDRLGDPALVAYVVARPGAALAAAELRSFVSQILPGYMVPAGVVILDALPLTPNGKVDRRALKEPDEQPEEAGAFAAPRNAVEEILVAIWAAVLGRERVGIHDHFFALGGHSLLATQVVSRVRRALGVDLPLRALFEGPTVAELTPRIEALRQDGAAPAPPLERVPHEGPLPLSFSQQRMWVTSRLAGDGAALNSAVPLRLTGDLDYSVLRQVLRELVRRHEVLRTRFPAINGEPVQMIEPAGEVALPVVDLRSLDEPHRQREAQRWTTTELGRPFDLARGPLLRVLVLRLSEPEHLVLPTMHHIITDEWSTRLLVEELTVLYGAFVQGGPLPLPEPRLQYADFAVWQRRWLSGAVLEAELEHWRRRLWAPVLPVELPVDGPNPTAPSMCGATHTVHLGLELSARLRALARQENATLFMAMLAAFEALLFRWTGQRDLVVVTDVANRTRPETERLLGFFANVLALRTTVSGNLSFRKLLSQVREVALEAYSHQELPFDELVRRLRLDDGPGGRRPFNVYFSLQSDVGLDVAPLAGVAVSTLERTGREALRDLLLTVQERSGVLSLTWLYKADLLRASTVEQMGRNFVTLLRALVDEPEACLQDLELLTEPEKGTQAMEQQRRESETLSRFKRVKPKAVSVSEMDLVTTHLLPGTDLPLVIEPSLADVDLYDWAASRRSWLDQELSVRGALLFRGFGVRSAATFERFCSTVAQDLYGDYGDLPRESEGDKIYGSTPYPPDKTILFHNESSHMSRWPMKQFFCCIQASVSGGETPLVDCRKVYQRLDPGLRDRFERLGLLYLRNFTSGLDVSWREFFRTDQRSEVERKCLESGIDLEWLGADDLRIGQRAPAVVRHPKTGEQVFFNQVQLHHASCLDAELRASLTSLFAADRLPRDVRYGDGTPIEDEVIEEITRLYWDLAVSVPWREGDVVMLDNMLVAHARNPYEGPRKILVAMAVMMEAHEASPLETKHL